MGKGELRDTVARQEELLAYRDEKSEQYEACLRYLVDNNLSLKEHISGDFLNLDHIEARMTRRMR